MSEVVQTEERERERERERENGGEEDGQIGEFCCKKDDYHFFFSTELRTFSALEAQRRKTRQN